MRNHIIFYSGGKSSFSVAHWVKEKYPDDNILLYFTDTLWEHPDLYRFIYEGSDKLKLPMLYHCFGLNPIQLMHKQAVVYNSRIGNCSSILKMGVAADWLKRHKEPQIVKWHNKEYLKREMDTVAEGFAENTTLYFGIGWDEMHREGPIKKNWQPFNVVMPHIEDMVDNNAVLAHYDIEEPELYKLGFTHNNCFGRCVKAGQGHFINLLQQLPEVFEKTMAYEHHMSQYVSAYHYYRAQHYFPESEQFDDDTLEILMRDLNDAYEDYFYERAPKPKVHVAPRLTAAPAEVPRLLMEHAMVGKRENGKWKWQRKKLTKRTWKWLVSDSALQGYRMVETRHLGARRYSYMKRSKGGSTRPYPLRNLYWDAKAEGLHEKPKNVIVQKQKSLQLDLFDVGGCGCDFSETSASACELAMN